MSSEPSAFIRTTVYLPRELHNKAKLMAHLSDSTLSILVIKGLHVTIKNLEEQIKKR